MCDVTLCRALTATHSRDAAELRATLRERAAYVAELEGRSAEAKQAAAAAEAEQELRLLTERGRAEAGLMFRHLHFEYLAKHLNFQYLAKNMFQLIKAGIVLFVKSCYSCTICVESLWVSRA